MKIFKTSIYKSILLIFTIILLLIGLFCSFIYMQGVAIIKEEVSQMIDEQNANMARNLQDQGRQLRLMQYQFVNYKEIMNLILADAQKDEERKREIIPRIQEGLLTIWRGNSLVEEVSVVLPDIDLVIKTGTNGKMDQNSKNLVLISQKVPSGTLFEFEEKVILISAGRDLTYFVYLELNTNALISLLGNSNREKTGINTLYNERSGEFLGRSIPIKAQEDIRSYMNKKEPAAEKDKYLITAKKVKNTEYYCVTFMERQSINRNMNLYRTFYLFLLLIIFTSVIWYWRKMFDMVHRPMRVLVNSLNNVTGGNFEEQINYRRHDEFQYIYDSFNNMTSRLKFLVNKNARQEILLQKAQIKQLQAQISPHFFYNSFITLSNRIQEEDYEFAAEFSRQLGQYFMFVTRSGREYITLQEEMEHAKTYMNIQRIRFRNRIRVKVPALKEQYQAILVPRLILQPVIENIFKYVVEKNRSVVDLEVSFQEENNFLKIIIENSGDIDPLLPERITKQLTETEGEIHALANIHQRLSMIYPDHGGLTIQRSKLGGLCVTITVQIKLPGES